MEPQIRFDLEQGTFIDAPFLNEEDLRIVNTVVKAASLMAESPIQTTLGYSNDKKTNKTLIARTIIAVILTKDFLFDDEILARFFSSSYPRGISIVTEALYRHKPVYYNSPIEEEYRLMRRVRYKLIDSESLLIMNGINCVDFSQNYIYPKKLEEEVLDSVVALDDLLEILYEIFSKNFGISQDLIKSESAKQEVVVCRRIICYLLYSKYKSNGVTYDKITSYVGEKTRSLVLKLVTQHSKKSAPHLNEYLVDYTFVLKVIKYRLTGKI